MKPGELFIGAIVSNTNGNVGKVIGIEYYSEHDDYDAIVKYHDNSTCYSNLKLLVPIELTGDILTKNGWFYKNGIWVKKGAPRLGWYPKDKTLIIGYHTFPIVVEYVHTLQAMQRILGAEEIKL